MLGFPFFRQFWARGLNLNVPNRNGFFLLQSRYFARETTARRPKRVYNAGQFKKDMRIAGGRAKRADTTPLWVKMTQISVLAGAAGLYYIGMDRVPYSDRLRWIITSQSMEAKLGEEAFTQLVKEASDKGKVLSSNHKAAQTVKRVLKRLITAMYMDRAQKGLPPLEHKWDFRVIDDEQINAAALPGGKVVVYTGLFRVTPTEDALAVILAHEISHVLARHGGEKISKSFLTKLIFYVMETIGIQGTGLLAGASALLMELPNSRECESEADAIGFEILLKACYDPGEGPKTFARMHKAIAELTGRERGGLDAYTSTHPSDGQRIAALEAKLPEALRRYQDGQCEQKRNAWLASFKKDVHYFNKK